MKPVQGLIWRQKGNPCKKGDKRPFRGRTDGLTASENDRAGSWLAAPGTAAYLHF